MFAYVHAEGSCRLHCTCTARQLACVPLLVAAIGYRAVLEERTLMAGLEGYADYAARVRYRFVPHV